MGGLGWTKSLEWVGLNHEPLAWSYMFIIPTVIIYLCVLVGE